MIKSYKDLEVWKLSFEVAMDIFKLTRNFPKEEVYSLTSQVVRSSRSISSNLTEGLAKLNYDGVFKHHLIHSLESDAETTNWLDFAKACDYISENEYQTITEKLEIIGKMITKLHQNWITK